MDNFEANKTIAKDGKFVLVKDAQFQNARAAEVGGVVPFPEAEPGYQPVAPAPVEVVLKPEPTAAPEAEAAVPAVPKMPQEILDAMEKTRLATEAEGNEPAVEEAEAVVETTEEPVNEPEIEPEALSEEEYVDRANEYSYKGYPDEQIDAWFSQPDEVRDITHPDGTTRMMKAEGQVGLTENQTKLLTYELEQTGYQLSPAQVDFLTEAYNVPEAAVRDYIDTVRQSRIQKATVVRQQDLKMTGMDAGTYDAALTYFNGLSSPEKAIVSQQLANAGARKTVLMGLASMAARK